MSEQPAGSVSTLKAAAPARKSTGLGRGLAGILASGPSDGWARPEGSGLFALLGRDAVGHGRRLSDFVIDVALGAIAEAFSLEGVVIAGVERAGGRVEQGEISLAVRLPAGMATESTLLFEAYGALWSRLRSNEVDACSCSSHPRSAVYPVAGRSLCVSQLSADEVRLAAVAFRREIFAPAEAEAMTRSLGSVVSVLASGVGGSTGDVGLSVQASVSSHAGISAEVSLRPSPPKAGGAQVEVRGVGQGVDIATAIAEATVDACGVGGQVVFAGASELDGQTVTVVIVKDSASAPTLGLAVRPIGDPSGPAHAVLSAVQPERSRQPWIGETAR